MQNNKRLRNRVVTTFLVVAMLCVGSLPNLSADYAPTTEWEYSTPEAQGMDSTELAAFIQKWSGDYYQVDALVAVRHGYVIAEAYNPPTGPDVVHHMYSASKSITSAMIGILIGEGLLSLEDQVIGLFPDHTFANMDANKEAMTVRDLLMMAGGFECNDLGTNWSASRAMESSDDWVQTAMDFPMVTEPGTMMDYCNPMTHILSAIITQKTGMSALDFAAERLFEPMGIEDYAWTSNVAGISWGYSELQLTALDMAKFGLLIINRGVWNDQQLVPADYTDAILQTQIETAWPDTSYSYQFWRMDSINLTFALGWAGQYIWMLPEHDFVMVWNGGFNEQVRIGTMAYPMSYELAALTYADDPLPDNDDGLALLQATLDNVNTQTPHDVLALPVAAELIDEQTFMLMNPTLMTVAHERRLDAYDMSLDTTALSIDFEDDMATMTLTMADESTWDIDIGLDGVHRISEGPIWDVAAVGEWITPHNFRVNIKYVGDANERQLDFHCAPGSLSIVSYEMASGEVGVIHAMQTS